MSRLSAACLRRLSAPCYRRAQPRPRAALAWRRSHTASRSYESTMRLIRQPPQEASFVRVSLVRCHARAPSSLARTACRAADCSSCQLDELEQPPGIRCCCRFQIRKNDQLPMIAGERASGVRDWRSGSGAAGRRLQPRPEHSTHAARARAYRDTLSRHWGTQVPTHWREAGVPRGARRR